MNRLAKSLQTLKTKHISKVGRGLLIETNIKSMPSHTMHCFRLPKKPFTRFIRLVVIFFEKKFNDDKGLPMIYWDKVCPPGKVEVLGLSDMEAINSAFLDKLNWKLFHDRASRWNKYKQNI